MKIQQLFQELELITQNKETVFTDSGMINCYDKMQYGFFPLGQGILDANNKAGGLVPSKEIADGGIMVLGNDFGTVDYVKDNCNAIGETEGKTVKNLVEKAMVNVNRAFFTNFYLGLRLTDEPFEGTTMIKRVFNGRPNKLKRNYKELCFNFFMIQLKCFNPRIVICLGHDVKNALIEACGVSEWATSDSLKKIYSEEKHSLQIKNLGEKTFVVIPHPCDLRNFRKEHIDKLAIELAKFSKSNA